MSFSENVVVAETSYKNVRSFIILRLGKGLTSFNKDNSANFLDEKKSTVKFSGVAILENRPRNFKSNLAPLVVLELESKGLQKCVRDWVNLLFNCIMGLLCVCVCGGGGGGTDLVHMVLSFPFQWSEREEMGRREAWERGRWGMIIDLVNKRYRRAIANI